MLDKEVFLQIKQVWESERLRCNAPIKESPKLEDLHAIINTAFFASLKKEEGKSLEFSLALITEQEIDDTPSLSPDYRMQVKMKFPEPLPLNVETISKFGRAFEKDSTALAVELSENEPNQNYQIWGAIFFGPSVHNPLNFEAINFGGPGFTTQRPDCLLVTADSVGSLIIAFGGHNMGYFENGEFIQSVPSPFSHGAIGEYIEEALKSNRWFDRQNWHHYLQTIKKILFEAAKHREGATIVFSPPASIEEIKQFFNATYSFTGDLGINFLLNETIKTNYENPQFFPQKRILLGRRLETLARLSCIDGALVITTEWEMLGFGCKLIAPKWNGDVLIGPNSHNFSGGGSSLDRTKLGMRHNSAIDFIGSCPKTIAFVISEDGPIRGFVKRDENTILCWRDFRVAIVV